MKIFMVILTTLAISFFVYKARNRRKAFRKKLMRLKDKEKRRYK